MSKFNVIHDKTQQLFYINLGNDYKAWIKYKLTENNEVDFYTTLVPASHRGQGIAAMLVNQAFGWADEQGLQIIASCWYAEKKLQQR